MKKFFYLAAVALLASCSGSEVNLDNPGEEDLRIRFGGTVTGIDVDTRTPVAPTTVFDLQIAKTADFSTTANWQDPMAQSVAVATSAAGLNATPADLALNVPLYYNVTGLKTAFTAYHPAADSYTDGVASTSAPVVSWAIDGKTDIITNVTADVSGDKSNVTGTLTPTKLTFDLKHQLIQLRFFLVAQGQGAVTEWGDVTAITVNNTLPTANFTFPNTVTFNGTAAPVTVYGAGTDTALPATTLPVLAPATEQGYIMVAPKADGKYELTVTTANSSRNIEIDLTSAAVAGDSYAVTLTFKSLDILFDATLTDWVTAGKVGSADVE